MSSAASRRRTCSPTSRRRSAASARAIFTQIKLLGSYTFPYDIVFAGTLQSIPGPERGAIVTYSSDAIAASLGRPLAAGGTIDINITPTAIMRGRLAKFAFQYNFSGAREAPSRTNHSKAGA